MDIKFEAHSPCVSIVHSVDTEKENYVNIQKKLKINILCTSTLVQCTQFHYPMVFQNVWFISSGQKYIINLLLNFRQYYKLHKRFISKKY